MSTSAINSSTFSNKDVQSSSMSRMPTQTLGQEDFLQLLVTQLTTQDPLNPQKDTEFIGQMVQFTNLENSKNLNSEIAQLRANSLLGHTVGITNAEDNTVLGIVEAVSAASETPRVLVNGGWYELSQIRTTTLTPENP